MTWRCDDPQGYESRKIKYLLPKYTRGTVLEVGCGMEKAFPQFVGYDSKHHFGDRTAAEVNGDAADLSCFRDESFDAVFSSHVLEHMEDMQGALCEWARVLKPGGYLCLYVPSANLYPKCGEPGANPDHKHDIYPGDICAMLDDSPYWFRQMECEERGQDREYSLFEVYKKLKSDDGCDADCVTIPLAKPGNPWLYGKTACVCRFGGYGDMLQAAVVFPRLKEQGYRLTVMTTPRGQDIIKADPHVDDWYIVDTDQVPNHELPAFWHEQSKRFTRFVNLSESIEGHLLAVPGRVNYEWPDAVRRKRMNSNYHEWTAELAEVPFRRCRLFYPLPDEIEAAGRLLGTEPAFNIVWALSGSSPHKFSPHLDVIVARIMLHLPEARVFMVGDAACKLLELGWEAEQRVIRLSGEIPIRETLALAQMADLVIGPETGVLNAVGMDADPHKILMLSHSSANNLSKHWLSTQALTPRDCDCYPCHRMHHSMAFCTDYCGTGIAECAMMIDPDEISRAIGKVYTNWKRRRK